MYWLITVADKEVHKYPHRQLKMVLCEIESVKMSVFSALLEREILINQIKITEEEYRLNILGLEQRKITIKVQ